MSTHYDDTGPYVALTEHQRTKALKECKEYYKSWQRELGRKKVNHEVAGEMRDNCWHCVGRRACPAEADAWMRCFKSLRGCGEYNGATDCDAYHDPLRRCATEVTDDLFANLKK